VHENAPFLFKMAFFISTEDKNIISSHSYSVMGVLDKGRGNNLGFSIYLKKQPQFGAAFTQPLN